jgi:hypothetical protein
MAVSLNVRLREEPISPLPLLDGLDEATVVAMLYPWRKLDSDERIGVVRLHSNIRLPAIVPRGLSKGWETWQVELTGVPCTDSDSLVPPIGVLRLVAPSEPGAHAGEVVGRVLSRSTVSWPNAFAVALVGGPVVPIAGLREPVGGLRRFVVDVGQIRMLTRRGQSVRLALITRASRPSA